jgi:hypothetical protein
MFPSPMTTATPPKILLTLNLGNVTTFIPIGVLSVQGVSGNYTGFTYAAATTSSVASINWIAIPY